MKNPGCTAERSPLQMRTTFVCVAALCLSAPAAVGQKVTFGVIGGTHLTNNFIPYYESNPADAFNPANRFSFETGPKSLILGATLEGRLSDAFSIEANALHRPLKALITFTDLYEDGTSKTLTDSRTPVRVWEFPVLLKYEFRPVQIAAARPFLTVGP